MKFLRYPSDCCPILDYWLEIVEGREVVSRKVRKTYEHLVCRLLSGEGEFFYSPARANHVIEFIENYCHNSKGKTGGELVRLELWERAMLSAIFGFVDIEGNRQYHEALLIVGKKNGKSLLSSAVGDYMLLADGEAGPEVYAVATKRDQAKIIWGEARRMIRKSPALLKRVRTLVAEIVCDGNDGVFKPLASDSDTLDGLNIHCGLMDEIHQWKAGRPLYDIIADGTGGREQPLLFVTTTAGTIREDIYDEKYAEAERVINGYGDPEGYADERFIAFVYELDDRKEWQDEACWKKANPGLGTIKPIDPLRRKAERARQNPDLVRNLLCKEFNIPETPNESWLSFDAINNRDTYTLDPKSRTFVWHRYLPESGKYADVELPYPRYGIGGADLSQTTDLTAAAVLFRVPGCDVLFRLSMYWLPEELIEKRAKEDNIPYDRWRDKGLMRASPGNKINPRVVTEWFWEVQSDLDIYLPWVGYDAWSATYWVDEMKDRFGPASMIAVHQGKKTLSNPMQLLGVDLSAKKVCYNNNPIDKWCLVNTTREEDRNGNVQPHKSSKPSRRIDGTAAMLNAYVLCVDKQGEYEQMIS